MQCLSVRQAGEAHLRVEQVPVASQAAPLEILMPAKYDRKDPRFWTEICVSKSGKTVADFKFTDKNITKEMYQRLEEFMGADCLRALKDHCQARKKGVLSP